MAWPPDRGSTLSHFMPTNNQFPSLGGQPSNGGSATQYKPTSTLVDIASAQGTQAKLAYHVTGSKKGGFPVTVEKRNCGKNVTVIRNVVGDRSALLSGLKKKMGCGGVINQDGSIEVQGERQHAVEKFLTEMDCLKSVSSKAKKLAAPTKAAKAEEPTKIDRKMAAARAPTNKGGPAAEISSMTEQAAKKMKPAEMKAHLKAAGLSIQGNKKELLARLLEQIKG